MTDTTSLRMQMDTARLEAANIIRAIHKRTKAEPKDIAEKLQTSTGEVSDAIKFGGPMHPNAVYLACKVIDNRNNMKSEPVDAKIEQDTSPKPWDKLPGKGM